MKNLARILPLALILALTAWAAGRPALAQSQYMYGCPHHAAPSASADIGVHTASGVVTELDAAAGRVVLRHEAVPSLNWPPMVMGFLVEDKSLLSGLKPGDKVRFDFTAKPDGNAYIITDLEKTS